MKRCVERGVPREREKMVRVSPILIPKEKLPPIRWIRAKVSRPDKSGWTSVLFDPNVDIPNLLDTVKQNPIGTVFLFEPVKKGKYYLFPLGDESSPGMIHTLDAEGSNHVIKKWDEDKRIFVWDPQTSPLPSTELREAKSDNYTSRVLEVEYSTTSLTFIFV